MSTTYDDSHWYIDGSHFRERGKHSGLVGFGIVLDQGPTPGAARTHG